ncbi:hypothetical protein CWS20_24695, partial [Cytobacillus horneckiae]
EEKVSHHPFAVQSIAEGRIEGVSPPVRRPKYDRRSNRRLHNPRVLEIMSHSKIKVENIPCPNKNIYFIIKPAKRVRREK